MERFFRTVRAEFLVELDDRSVGEITHLTEPHAVFAAWLGSIPQPLPLLSTADLREALLWSEFRTVAKTGSVSLHGNSFSRRSSAPVRSCSFGRDLAPSMLHQPNSHREAVRGPHRVVHQQQGDRRGRHGQDGRLKGAVSSLNPARFTVIYQPDPEVGP